MRPLLPARSRRSCRRVRGCGQQRGRGVARLGPRLCAVEARLSPSRPADPGAHSVRHLSLPSPFHPEPFNPAGPFGAQVDVSVFAPSGHVEEGPLGRVRAYSAGQGRAPTSAAHGPACPAHRASHLRPLPRAPLAPQGGASLDRRSEEALPIEDLAETAAQAREGWQAGGSRRRPGAEAPALPCCPLRRLPAEPAPRPLQACRPNSTPSTTPPAQAEAALEGEGQRTRRCAGAGHAAQGVPAPPSR